jgi:protease-4
MKSFFKTLLATIIGFFVSLALLTLIFVSIIAAMAAGFSKEETVVDANSILTINLENGFKEREDENPFAQISFGDNDENGNPGLREMLLAIKHAKTDDKIKGIVFKSGFSPNSYATLQEVRNALVDFKASGKFIYSYAEMLEEHAYFITSLSDKIYLHPNGDMLFNGTSYNVAYLKNMFDKIGVEMQLIRHGKYKAAGEPLIADEMSDDNREQIKSFTGDVFNSYMSQIAESRKLSLDTLMQISSKLKVQSAKDAITYGLVDGVKYADEFEDEVKALVDSASDKKDLNYISLAEYNSTLSHSTKDTKDKIALIYAEGEIVSGEGDQEQMGSENMAKAIRKARKDSSVKAIVLRINSPGGSALASDVIWREVILTKKVKPVIVSMGDVAASGGYYIAAPADVIVAQPSTITGSIGVFGAIPNMQNLLNNKLGIKFEKVNSGDFSDFGSVDRPLRADEKAIIQNMIDRIYNDFIEKVAEGRKIDKNKVNEIAQGRVWAGTSALRIGLVDTLGGIETAMAIAAKKAGIETYKVMELPKQKNAFEEFVKSFKTEVSNSVLKAQLGEWYPYYQQTRSMLQINGIQARMMWNVVEE